MAEPELILRCLFKTQRGKLAELHFTKTFPKPTLTMCDEIHGKAYNEFLSMAPDEILIDGVIGVIDHTTESFMVEAQTPLGGYLYRNNSGPAADFIIYLMETTREERSGVYDQLCRRMAQ